MLSKKCFKEFQSSSKKYSYYSLPELAKLTQAPVSRLPVSIRIVLESVLRNCDNLKVHEKDVLALCKYNAKNPAAEEIPFIVSRIVLQDFTGVPLLVDLAAMRDAMSAQGKDPKKLEPLVPVDLVVDHSVQVDYAGSPDSYKMNLKKEFERNRERYEFLKWGQSAFDTFKVVPPGIGIVHQVNLEYLARGIFEQKQVLYPDSLVGTDSHTTMINGLGIVGWGVGGIEAEAGMLGQPLYFLTPEVVGVYLTGKLREGVTATDLTLTLTELLRKTKVVGKFVEYFGPGAAALSLPDRATVANMAPEYGATMGFFPTDEETLNYFNLTGRDPEKVKLIGDYYKQQELFGIPLNKEDIDYTQVIELDLSTIVPSVAGPKRPQDRISLPEMGNDFRKLFAQTKKDGGFEKKSDELKKEFTLSNEKKGPIHHGDVVIAAITSCTNTSNPSVMIAAGLLAQKAVAKGLKVHPRVKTSLAPGSRVVTDYLEKSGLQTSLDKIGFNLVGYGCTTCIGNSGPLDESIEKGIMENDLVVASVLSGNRNFEARVHPAVKSNFLMSPPLVVAFALAGSVERDLTKEAIGKDTQGADVYLKDIWPKSDEIRDVMAKTLKASVFRELYADFVKMNPEWNEIPSTVGNLYKWNEKSTYIQNPPYFHNFKMQPSALENISGARVLGIFGDSVTTDHISPAGSFKKDSPAGKFLLDHGVDSKDFNSYGSRRGNDKIMTRGTFANVRIKNLMLGGVEGGLTKDFSQDGKVVSIFEASENYKAQKWPMIIFGGKEYGTGSSRDWAAKGPMLLGVKVVVAESFERIHRSNLVGMGILPCCFKDGANAQSLGLDGSEVFSINLKGGDLNPRQDITLEYMKEGKQMSLVVQTRLDTPIEVEYFKHGGILPYVLRQIIKNA
jgi:aconitate hydratase